MCCARACSRLSCMPTKFHKLSTLELAKIARTWSFGSNIAGPHWAYHFLGGTAYDFSFRAITKVVATLSSSLSSMAGSSSRIAMQFQYPTSSTPIPNSIVMRLDRAQLLTGTPTKRGISASSALLSPPQTLRQSPESSAHIIH